MLKHGKNVQCYLFDIYNMVPTDLEKCLNLNAVLKSA